ncbi:MAG: transglycosylase SLT domain-containing protein [Candidatus Delongbacteria bacterium]|nr:transglycosylase SLT domain-containing protein [Candidatus Delongbacteria bacterium]
MKNYFKKHLNVSILLILSSCLTLYANNIYKLPEKIDFAGSTVPLEIFDVRNRIEIVFNNLIYDRRGYMQSIINKQKNQMSIAENILGKFGLDPDFAYVIPVESNFNSRATSPSKASGPWQLMPATARMYGLRVDSQVNERNLIDRSSRASAEHLAHLMNIFDNNVFLVLAAFNNGERNVVSMLKSQNSKDFWSCISNSETDLYVPKIIAYKIILSDPQKYGFQLPTMIKRPIYESCMISLGGEDLPYKKITEFLNISFREFYDVNPHLKYNSYKLESSIPKFTALEILVPQYSKENLLSSLRNNGYLTSDNIAFNDSSDNAPTISEKYTVENSDNIESIAFRYGISWKKIAELNDLEIVTMSSGTETAKIYPGQKLIINR